MQMAKDDILIQESGRDALGRLHEALSKLGYVCEKDAGRSPFCIYHRKCAKPARTASQIMLDVRRHTIHADGNEATLTNHECLLLKHLVEHPCNVATRNVILNTVFGNALPPESDIISPCVCALRRKLRSIGHADVIKTIRGTGYHLSPLYLTRITIGTCTTGRRLG